MPDLETTYLAESHEHDRRRHLCGIRRDGGRQYCSCRYWERSGKRCSGLWALATLQLCGRVAEFERDRLAMIPPKLHRPKKDDLEASNEDMDDVIDYWGRDVFGDGETSLLQVDLAGLRLEPGQDHDEQRPSRSPSPVSPIRRRFRDTRNELEAIQTDTVTSDRGRPLKIRPLQPSRKAQKSTVGVPNDKIFGGPRPTGSQNSGNDCFALSLLHLLLRQPEWNMAFDLVWKVPERRDTVLKMVNSVRKAIHEKNDRGFPTIHYILRSKLLIA